MSGEGNTAKPTTNKQTYNQVNTDDNKADGFFSNPFIRFPTIGGILVAFSFLQVFDIGDIQDAAGDIKNLCNDYLALGGVYATTASYMDCDYYDQMYAGATIQLIGIIFILIFSVAAIVISCKCGANCDVPSQLGANAAKIGLVVMIGLIIGGIFYIIGFLVWNTTNEYTLAGASFSLSGYGGTGTATGTGYGTDYSTDVNAYLSAYTSINWETVSDFYKVTSFMETLLGGFVAIVFGYDIWKQLLNNDKKRLLLQSLVPLIVVSIICFIGYAYIATELDNGETGTVAAGYFFIAVGGIVGILLFLGKIGGNAVTVGIVVGVMLILGSFLCAVGFWAGSGGAYATGYIALLMGVCVVDALDMGLWDNVKTCNDNSNNNSNNNNNDN